MKKIEKPGHIKEDAGEEFSFTLWKSELDKELMAFWKSLLDK
jgi:hypothetical protein